MKYLLATFVLLAFVSCKGPDIDNPLDEKIGVRGEFYETVNPSLDGIYDLSDFIWTGNMWDWLDSAKAEIVTVGDTMEMFIESWPSQWWTRTIKFTIRNDGQKARLEMFKYFPAEVSFYGANDSIFFDGFATIDSDPPETHGLRFAGSRL